MNGVTVLECLWWITSLNYHYRPITPVASTRQEYSSKRWQQMIQVRTWTKPSFSTFFMDPTYMSSVHNEVYIEHVQSISPWISCIYIYFSYCLLFEMSAFGLNFCKKNNKYHGWERLLCYRSRCWYNVTMTDSDRQCIHWSWWSLQKSKCHRVTFYTTFGWSVTSRPSS